MHIGKAIKRFMEHLESNDRSVHTIGSYNRDLRVFAGWLKGMRLPANVRKLTPEIVSRFFTSTAATLRADGRPKKHSSVNRSKLVLKSFFAYLEQAWIVERSPARLLRCKRERRAITDILSSSEKKKLLATVRASGKSRALRDGMIIALFLSTGIRIDSLIHLDIGDVDLEARSLCLRKMKGGVQSSKGINSRLAGQLRRYLSYRNTITSESSALFLSNRGNRISRTQVGRVVKYWAEVAGIKKGISTKSFRHSFASELYQRTKDILAVKEALDHTSVTTTEIYTHVALR